MGPRLGGLSPSTPGWIILVLWGPGQGSRRHSESRGGQGRPLRLRLTGTDHEEESALLRPHLPAGVRAAGLLSPRCARAKGKRKGGRGLDSQSGAPTRRRKRRVGGVTEEGAGAPDGKRRKKRQGGAKGAEEEEGVGGVKGDDGRREEEEKEKEVQGQERGAPERASCWPGSSEGTEPALCRDSVRPGVRKETKAKALAEKYPGALAMETLKNLLTTAGEDGDLKNDPGGTPVLQDRAREESDKGTVDLSNRHGCLTQKGGRPQRSTSFAKG